MWPWLMSFGGWAVKLLGGWLPIGTKPVSEWLGKLLFAIGTSVMVFWLMTNFGAGCGKKKPLEKNPGNQQIRAGGSVENPTYNLSGCAHLTIKGAKP